jgi:hypothetical protein
MRDLVVACHQFAATSSDEPKATILDFEPPAVEPYKTMPVGVRYAGLFKPKAADQHRLPARWAK